MRGWSKSQPTWRTTSLESSGMPAPVAQGPVLSLRIIRNALPLISRYSYLKCIKFSQYFVHYCPDITKYSFPFYTYPFSTGTRTNADTATFDQTKPHGDWLICPCSQKRTSVRQTLNMGEFLF